MATATKETAFEFLTANFSVGGKTRRVTFNGRNYIVAPMTLLKQGVLKGNKGPLYYPNEEITKNYHAWNNMPIVVNHPEDANGNALSARSPAILEQYQIGFVFNTRFEGKLIAEGWFDIEKTKQVDPRIMAAIEAGKPMELSTGLFTQNQEQQGDYNGKEYVGVARNYVPDHLAILPDQPGACSIKDGCGLNINAENEEEVRSWFEKFMEFIGNEDGNGEQTGPETKKKCDCEDKNNCKCDKMKKGKMAKKKLVKNVLWVPTKNNVLWNAGNCGIGSGGFQPGNKCAAGGSSSDGITSMARGSHTVVKSAFKDTGIEVKKLRTVGKKARAHDGGSRALKSPSAVGKALKKKGFKEAELNSSQIKQYGKGSKAFKKDDVAIVVSPSVFKKSWSTITSFKGEQTFTSSTVSKG